MASVDMFGTGGEALGGLFTGQQAAQQQNLNDAQVAQQQASAAHANALAESTDLSNQYEQAILGDKIKVYQQEVLDKQAASKEAQFKRTGEQFGQLSTVLGNVPAAARPATLQKMASDLGVPADSPMLQHMMSIDPEQLPDALSQFSSKFYEQSDAARAEKQKRDAMLLQAQEQGRMRSQDVQDRLETQRQIAADRNATLAAIAAMREGGANQRAAAKSGAGGKPFKETTDNAIARMVKDKVDSGEWTADEGREALLRYKYTTQTVGKSPTTANIMGEEEPTERAARLAQGGSSPTTAARPAAPKVGTESKGYRFKGGDPSKKENWEKM